MVALPEAHVGRRRSRRLHCRASAARCALVRTTCGSGWTVLFLISVNVSAKGASCKSLGQRPRKKVVFKSKALKARNNTIRRRNFHASILIFHSDSSGFQHQKP